MKRLVDDVLWFASGVCDTVAFWVFVFFVAVAAIVGGVFVLLVVFLQAVTLVLTTPFRA